MNEIVRQRPMKNADIRRFNDLCTKHKAINLAQGLCHIECSDEKGFAIDGYIGALNAGRVQPGFDTYCDHFGLAALREAVAKKANAYNGLDVSAKNVMITVGGLGACHCALEACVDPHEEVILLEPFYPYHLNQLLAKHMKPKPVRLRGPAWSFDEDDLQAAVTSRTRAIIVTNPSNPNGKVFSREELETITRCCCRNNLIAIADEAYEFMTFDGRRHISLASLPGMSERTITLWSFGKMLSTTGWRLGCAVASEEQLFEMGKSNECVAACGPTPAQHGVIPALQDIDRFRRHGVLFQKKRDLVCGGLEAAGIPFSKPEGAAYVLADVTGLKSKWGLTNSEQVTIRMIQEYGVGCVPAKDFFSDDTGLDFVRFCFAVKDPDAEEGARRLAMLH
jgi:aminotransferase